ncbi:MAG: ABC transporter substrate-binding protein [Euryarchaeota archaeon]|nr:ABC transporter substrate-binding protein [Euryarchaeota archaeon]
MNKTRKIAIAAVCIILLTAILGAAYLGGLMEHLEPGEFNEESQIYPGYPRTIEDSAERNVTICKPITRIITLTSDGAEGVRTLGAVDNIVGVTDMINKDGKEYFPELENKPSVGTWKEFDYEEIVELAMNNTDGVVPGVLVISYVSKVPEVEEKLSSFENIAVVGLDLYKEETLDAEIVKLGYLLEREEAAQDFIAWRQEKIATVKSAVDGLEKPKVYIEKGSSTGTGELGTYGKGSAFNLFCEIAGGNNVASHFDTTYPKVDWEWVIGQEPDIIIKEEPRTFLEVTSKAEAMRAEVLNRPGAENMSAIKNDRVYILNRKMDYGLENVVGLTYWAKIFHPNTSLDPEAVYRDYIEKYQGLQYSEDKMVVYPSV